jgi:hypothetical protein
LHPSEQVGRWGNKQDSHGASLVSFDGVEHLWQSQKVSASGSRSSTQKSLLCDRHGVATIGVPVHGVLMRAGLNGKLSGEIGFKKELKR